MLLQNLSDEMRDYITRIYRKSVETAYVPQLWREMTVVFLPKTGKDRTQPKAYRPITLSNFMLKGLERIIQWILLEKYITEDFQFQHAYTQGLSTETALSEAVDLLEKNALRKGMALVCSLDCSGAFDNILHETVKESLEERKVPDCLTGWFMHLLRGRRVQAKVKGEVMTVRPTRGTPQGGVLSPLIWNIVMDKLLRKFVGKPTKVTCYADDLALTSTGVDEGTVYANMQSALDRTVDWGRQQGLTFNPSKTQAMMVTNKRKIKVKPLTMGGVPLEMTDNIKYLGLTIDKKLLWTKHIQEKVKKGKKLLNSVKAIIGQKWGLDPKKLFWVYTAMVRPVISYGGIVWAHALDEKGKRERLERLQRMILLAMTHAMRSTPTKGMEWCLGLLPLDLFVQREATKTWFRIKEIVKTTWDGISMIQKKSHRRWHEKKLEGLDLPRDQCRRKQVWKNVLETEGAGEPDLHIYTDGSRMNEQTGSGWVLCRGDHVIQEESRGLGKIATVYQAEAVAIADSLRTVNEMEKIEAGKHILLQSDSLSVLQSLQRHNITSTLILDVLDAIAETRKRHKLSLRWVRGHDNNTGNEMADYLAKIGSETAVAEEPCLAVTASFTKGEINKRYDVI
jgi:ribonuclease HI